MENTRRKFLERSVAAAAALPLLGGLEVAESPVQATKGTVPGKAMSKFLDVDGVRTRYFEGGSGEPLVLVHGGHFGLGTGAHGFMPLFAHVAPHFHYYAVDKLGMGLTGPPRSDADWTMRATVNHLYGFMQKIGVQKAVLAGHSRGALPVARIAIDHPELVRALVIFDSNTLAPGNPDPSVSDLPPASPPPTPESIRKSIADNRTMFHKDVYTDEYIRAEIEVAGNPGIREAALKMDRMRKQFIEKNPDLAREKPWLGHVSGSGWWMADLKEETLGLIGQGRLKTPTLIIWGFNDPSAPYKLGVDLLETLSPHVKRAELHVFNQSGHSVYAEYPAEVAKLLVDFAGRA